MPNGQIETDKNKKLSLGEYIERAIQGGCFAVLAAEGDGQPHASLIAITPVEGFRQLIFATYRSTNKYRNLLHNCKVAVLIEIGDPVNSGHDKDFVLTAYGNALEIDSAENEAELNAHLMRHPDLEMFLRSKDCALIRVTLEKFQLVHGIDDISWWSVDKLDTT